MSNELPEKPDSSEGPVAPVAKEPVGGDTLRQRFAASIPDFENGERIRHPFAASRLVVVFRRGMSALTIRQFFQRHGVVDFSQEKNPLTYVISPLAGENRFQLFKKISRNKQVRYIGPYREKGA